MGERMAKSSDDPLIPERRESDRPSFRMRAARPTEESGPAALFAECEEEELMRCFHRRHPMSVQHLRKGRHFVKIKDETGLA